MKFFIISLAFLFKTQVTSAALIISQFSMSTTEIGFNISGTIEGPVPIGKNWLFLVSENGDRNWDTPGLFETATIETNISVNGVSSAVKHFYIETHSNMQDSFTLDFWPNALEVGDTLFGTFNATWNTPITSSIPERFALRWGRNVGDELDPTWPTAMQGTLQGVTVPLPAGIYLFLSGLVGLGLMRVKI